MNHLAPGKWSTAALMRVIVPIALELVLFQDVWRIVLIPPFTILIVALNLGLFFVLVRPRSWETRIIGMLLAGVLAVLVSVGDYLTGNLMKAGPPGLLGRALRSFLMNCADSLGDPAGDLASVLRLAVRHMTQIEGVLLVLLGITLIWAGGWLENRCRVGWAGRRAAAQAGEVGSIQVP